MTAPNAAESQRRIQYQINLGSDDDRELAAFIFTEKPGLAAAFASAFNIQFVSAKGDKVTVMGSPSSEGAVRKAFSELVESKAKGRYVTKDMIKKLAGRGNASELAIEFDSAANQNIPKAPPREATPAQKELEKQIGENDLTFAIGPAGTGKTFVAMKMAVEALKNKKVKKILLARPATEAGESIGFLPGDSNAKLAPYMRPLYDELDKAFGKQTWEKMMKDGVIEVVPVGYMRGRTFEDAFIILDESQNCTKEQFKMAITRIGFNSKMVVTGDQSQIDLPRKEDSGLMYYYPMLKDKPGIGSVAFEGSDVVRSKIVQTIVDAVEDCEKAATAPEAASKQPSPYRS